MATGLAKIETLSDWMRPRARRLVKVLEQADFSVEIYSARRTEAEQRELVAKGWSRTMRSKHLTGDAVDLIIEPAFGYRFAGMVWTSFGGRWGGDFKDAQLAELEHQHYEKLA